MNITSEHLQQLLNSSEDEKLEFKAASSNFHFEKLVKYCAALANEGGGYMVLGVTDKRPRTVVGSQAFSDLARTKAGLVQKLHLRIEATELDYQGKRVVIFAVPARPIGMPLAVEGAYWMRSGESLTPMTPDALRRIFDEGCTDFSAEICPELDLQGLSSSAIGEFQKRWASQAKNPEILRWPPTRLLYDSELAYESGISYAGLILLGTAAALGRYLPQAEIVFEYRSGRSAGPANQRIEFREGFLLFCDRLWDAINLRNDTQHFQDGLFIRDIPTFSEGAVREAILNAVSHRDYRLSGSVFIRQYPRDIEIVSPGGFPPGITPQNILNRQNPRNRRIAEAFEKCDLVERAGQGANRMFEEAIKQSKPLPDFSDTDAHQVSISLRGEIQDTSFLRFLEKVGQDRIRLFGTEEFIVLDMVRRESKIPERLQSNLRQLLEDGIVESIGRGRGVRYILARQFYRMSGRGGAYTRKIGLDRDTNMQLLLKHLSDNATDGSPLQELRQVLPAHSEIQIKYLLKLLRSEGKASSRGHGRGSRWFPVSP